MKLGPEPQHLFIDHRVPATARHWDMIFSPRICCSLTRPHAAFLNSSEPLLTPCKDLLKQGCLSSSRPALPRCARRDSPAPSRRNYKVVSSCGQTKSSEGRCTCHPCGSALRPWPRHAQREPACSLLLQPCRMPLMAILRERQRHIRKNHKKILKTPWMAGCP